MDETSAELIEAAVFSSLLDLKVTMWVFTLAIVYGLVVFLSSVSSRRSQLVDYGDIPVVRAHFKDAERVIDVCAQAIDPRTSLKFGTLFRVWLSVIPALRVLGYLPLPCFVTSLGVYVLRNSQYVISGQEWIPLENFTFVLATASLVLYFIVKVSYGVAEHLVAFHPSYRNKPIIPVIFEVIPMLKAE